MKNLKKFAFLALLVALVGCGGGKNSSKVVSSSSTNSNGQVNSTNSNSSINDSSSSSKNDNTISSSSSSDNINVSTGDKIENLASYNGVVIDNAGAGSQENALKDASKLNVWYDPQNWCGAVITASATYENDALTINSQLNDGSCWFGLQVFGSISNIQAGATYEVKMNLNSTVAGKITFCGNVVDIKVGDNLLTAEVVGSTSVALVNIQFGVVDGDVNANNALLTATYVLNDINVVMKQPAPDVPDSEVGVNLLAYNGVVIDNAGAGSQENALKDASKLHVWYDPQNWCGAVITASATYENDALTINSQLNDGSCWFGLQVFGTIENLQNGTTYEVSMNLNSTVAGKITFCGNVVDINVGDNLLTVTVTGNIETAPINIQFGVVDGDVNANNALLTATYILSNMSVKIPA